MFDEITNRGDGRTPHHWLYHVNFGYPLLDQGTRLIYKGRATYVERPEPKRVPTEAQLNRLKKVTGPIAAHAEAGERCLIVEQPGQRDGRARVGVINDRLSLGVEMAYPVDALPRLTSWQHYGPAGCYVSAMEPFSGSLFGKAVDPYPKAEQYLRPGQTKRYELVLRVLSTKADLAKLAKHDGKVFH